MIEIRPMPRWLKALMRRILLCCAVVQQGPVDQHRTRTFRHDGRWGGGLGTSRSVRSRRRSISFAVLLNFFLVQTVPLSTPAPAGTPAQSRPDRASATEDWAAAAQRAAADSEYEITGPPAAPQGGKGAYQAPNRAHNFRTWFADEGVRIVPRTAESPQWDLSISLVGYGRGADVRPVDPPALDPQRNRIDYRRGGLIEWYVNDDRGLEQGFTLSSPPENLPKGPAGQRAPGRRGTVVDTSGTTDPAFVVLRIGGDLFPTVAADGQAVEFVAERGGLTVVRYGDLKVFDALGRDLPAWMEGFAAEGIRGIRLLFDDTDAVYPVTIDPLATGASWTGEADQEGAGFGWSVASAGDVNGDGYGDVIVGAPYFDANGDASGRAFIYYGSPSGLPAAPGVTFSGEGPGALLGSSVAAAGNVNGLEDGRCVGGGSPGAACTDQAQCFPGTCAGYDDVLVGAPGFALVQVRYGGPGGPVGPYKALQDAPTTGLGHSVASAGDINRDGFGDIVVGAPFYDCPGMQHCGKVQVHYGSSIGPLAPGWIKEGDAAGAQLGWTVAAGDVTGTSDPDLIVSAPGPPTGRAYVYPGSAAGPSSSAAWSATFTAKRDLRVCSVTQTQSCAADSDCAIPKCWSCTPAETCSAARINPYLSPYNRSTFRNSAATSGGTLVAATGDVNGDGTGDWIVGSPYFDDPNQAGADEGRVDVYYGATILSPTQAASWSSIGDPGSFFGWSVAGAGDTNADGVADVLVGARGADNPATDEGRASVFLGSTAGPTSEPTWTVEGEQYYAALGFSVASAGDVNGDGSDDVVVGAPNAQRGQFLEGIATVHQGSAGLTQLVVGDALGFTVYYTRAELQDFVRGVLSPQLASAAVGFGPVPGSILLSTGRASDGGLGDTDWGDPNSPDKTVFELRAPVPPQKKSFCFSSQFITSETDPGLDKAFFCHDREGGACSSPVHDLSALATGRRNAPVGHCFDVDGKSSLFLHFEVTDGGGNGANDSAVILSRIYFSDLPLPPDAMPETTADGYFQNPAPLDVSRLAGTYSFTRSLLKVPGVTSPFELTVSYDSGSTSEGALGPKWSHSYENSAQRLADGDDQDTLPDAIRVQIGPRVEYFKQDPNGRYEPQFGTSFSSLAYDPNAVPPEVTYVTQDRTTHIFNDEVVDPLRPPAFYKLQLTSITDINGGVTQLGYDPSDHRLTGVTDTRGKQFSFLYTQGGLLRAVRSDPNTPQQAEVGFEHDAGTGVLRSFTDLDGRTTTFTSTADGRILTGTNADGVTFVAISYEQFDSIAVDQQGDRVSSRRDGRDPDPSDPDAGMILLYEADTLVSIDRLDPPRQDSRQYDAKGRVAAQVDRTGVRTEFDYDRNNNRIETRRQLPSEPAPRVVDRSRFDGRGNLTRKTDFPGSCIADPGASCTVDQECPGSTCGIVEATTYDLNDNPRSVTDHYGNRSEYDYDPAGNLIRERDALGHETTYTYGTVPGKTVVSPQPVTMTDARGFTTTNEYDANGYLIRTTNAVGATVTQAWDARGRRIAATDPLAAADPLGGHKTCSDYDAAGRLVRVRALCGSPSEYVRRSMAYDAEGRTVARTEADGAVSRTVYTATGQVEEQTNPLGQSVRYGYDLEDRLTTSTRPSPASRAGSAGGSLVDTAYAYDDGDRLTLLTESAGACVGGDPAAAGMACASDAECPGGGRCGLSVQAAYDEIGNLVGVEDPAGKVRRFEHDLLGRVVAQGEDTDNDGAIDAGLRESRTFDGRGLLTSLTTPRGDTIAYSYDAAGRNTGVTFGAHSVSHALDAKGNPVSSVLDGAAITRVFDPLDRVSSRIDEFGNQVDVIRDLAGRPSRIVYPSDLDGDGNRDRAVYEYDALHRLTSVTTDWDGRRATYGYDPVGRLTRATLPDGSVVTYDYDAAGRPTGIADPQGGFVATYRLNGAGVRTAADITLPLDPDILLDDVTYTYGPRNEILASSAGASFTYDASGNMVSGTIGGSPVTLVHNEVGQLVSVNGTSYRYDAEGLRVEIDDGASVRRLVYEPVSGLPRLLEEQDASGNVVARYVHGLGLISRTSPGSFRVYHYDSRGSTVSLTDGAGAITDRYAYDPYGRPAGHAGSTLQPFRYNGRDGVFDDGNGLYYMRARYYAPELQRFLQMDQAYQGDLTDTQSLNRYAYVQGDPIQRIDPGGDFWGVVIGAGLGGLTSVALECWDGCSTSELVGAAVEGVVAGAIVGANPVAGLWQNVGIGAAAGFFGALAGVAAHEVTAVAAGDPRLSLGDVFLRLAAGTLGGAVGGGLGFKIDALGDTAARNAARELARAGAPKAAKVLGPYTVRRSATNLVATEGFKLGADIITSAGIDWLHDNAKENLGCQVAWLCPGGLTTAERDENAKIRRKSGEVWKTKPW